MSGQTDQVNVEHGQAVQTSIESGEWVSLKDASDRTGLSQKTLRRYVKKKTLRTRRLGKSSNSPIQVFLTQELVNSKDAIEEEAIHEATVEEAFDEDDQYIEEEDIDFRPGNSADDFEIRKEAFRAAIDECIKPLVNRIEEQATIIADKDREIADKERQLKLLPDLEKQAREKEEAANLRAFENDALKKQLELLQMEKVKLEKEAKEVGDKAEESGEKSKQLEEELEMLRSEMDVLKKPWWKKWFLPREIEES